LKRVPTSLVSIMASALIATAISTSASFAADLPPIVEIPPEIIPHSYGGWYLRGDIGYAKSHVKGVSYFQGASQSGKFERHDIDNGWLIGGGLGYQVNDWFRVDVTSNYHGRVDFKGSSAQNVACSDGTAGAVCSYSDNGDLQITTLMANAYLDLGTYQGLTPYVGAGLGGAYLHWGDVLNVESNVSGAVPAVLANDVHGKRSGWRFAYGLHAGMSYDITSNMKIDAGYSYTRISEGEMFGFGRTSGLSGTQGYHKQLNNHAFKVGLRYAFN
jgi:opacity protein-like surface antigen